ncbi:MAG: MBL fold metallo-hydrolase [Candidatus Abyssubacteria bacterium]
MGARVSLTEVEGVEILTLVDNVVDLLLESDEHVKRAPRIRDGKPTPPLLAEHGFSALVRVAKGGTVHTILLDTGMGEATMLINADRLGVDLGEVEAVVISHGHFDHINGLRAALGRLRARIPIVIHPHAFVPRIMKLPDGTQVRMTPLDAAALERSGAEIIRRKEPSLLADGTVLVTGQIPRVTDFEFGLPVQYAVVNGVEQHDPLTPDDQSIAIAVRGKGLVIVSGCAHAGIINSIRYVCELTGLQNVHAIVGGFHLAGPLYEGAIEPTVKAIEQIRPELLLPTHCTGWKAIHTFARRLPESFVQNSVGTRLVLGSVPSAQRERSG